MKSKRTKSFKKAFDALPTSVQEEARNAYKQFAQNPSHPSLRFKKMEPTSRGFWEARVGLHYRAVGVMDESVIAWFWIGTKEAFKTKFGGT